MPVVVWLMTPVESRHYPRIEQVSQHPLVVQKRQEMWRTL